MNGNASDLLANRIDVVVLNWNTRDLTAKCVETLVREGGALLGHVVIVDNGSTDGSAEHLASRFPDAKVVKNAKNVGFGAGMNTGLRWCESDLVLFLNSDCFVTAEALGLAREAMLAEPTAAIVGVSTVDLDGRPTWNAATIPTACDLILETILPIPARIAKRFVRYRTETRDTPGFVECVAGHFMMLRRRAFLDIGMFDESFFLYLEEADISLRFQARGWKVYLEQRAVVMHVGHASDVRPHWSRSQVRVSALRFLRKHHEGLPYLSAVALDLIARASGMRFILNGYRAYRDRAHVSATYRTSAR